MKLKKLLNGIILKLWLFIVTNWGPSSRKQIRSIGLSSCLCLWSEGGLCWRSGGPAVTPHSPGRDGLCSGRCPAVLQPLPSQGCLAGFCDGDHCGYCIGTQQRHSLLSLANPPPVALASHRGAAGSIPSALLLREQQKMAQVLGYLYPHGTPGGSSWLPSLEQSSCDHCGRLGSESIYGISVSPL